MRRSFILVASVAMATLTLDGQSQDSLKSPTHVRPSVVIAEVLFDPAPGADPFVELLNTGTTPVSLRRMALDLGDTHVPLMRVTAPLAAASRLVVTFDGKGSFDGGMLHAASGATLKADGGAVELADEWGEAVDRVAWGNEDGAIDGELAAGKDELRAPGRTLGRPPGANTPFDTLQWTLYRPAEATPGGANPQPAVDTLIPLNGDIVTQSRVPLHWYRATGATQYRVQLARDQTFTAMLMDVTVSTPEATSPALTAGDYVWRVQAIAGQGRPAPFSSPHVFTVEPAAGQFSSISSLPALKVTTSPAQQQGHKINVPLLQQHKDTHMLQLENPREKDPHGWDLDHRVYDASDPADSDNCVIASVAMVNHKLGGDLSQDRIGYEVKSRNGQLYLSIITASPDLAGLPYRQSLRALQDDLRETRPGPEADLLWGHGLNPAQTVAAMTFALGGLAHYAAFRTEDALWKAVTAEIDRDRPVLGDFGTNHMSVVTGYGVRPNGQQYFWVNDPVAGETRRQPAAAGANWYLLPPNPVARRQELSVSQDSDGDGVYDFDETERFFTDPHGRDSDHDGVEDKEDIVSGVFDTTFGYAYYLFSHPSGRDIDADGLPTERDPDSDNGGCVDGVEDADHNGHHQPKESWNFDDTDDVCRNINGKLLRVVTLENIDTLEAYIHEMFMVTVAVRPEVPGQMGSLVDRGSYWRMSNVRQIVAGADPCQITGRVVARGGGRFKNESGNEIGGYITNDELIIAAGATVKTKSYTQACFGSGEQDWEDGGSWGDCTGKRVAADEYRFDCTTPPPPLPGMRILVWSLTGSVKLVPNQPVDLVEPRFRLLKPPR